MKFLVPLDFSQNSKRALQSALNLLKEGDEIILLSVVQMVNPGALGYLILDKNLKEMESLLDTEDKVEKTKEALKGHEKEVQEKGAKCSVVVTVGDAREEIVKVAEEQKAEQIIMGSRGLGMISSLILGSVSDYVVKHAKTNVTVVK
eukprot:TRINITY_DN6298_c0_g1_i1.p1 TRINITY_DN6298_c0_g1~~TRINITY_DN6298_c0_g1_i1.p1  ORF type:complete len:147 (+),score=29.13 TRINITY_DN6298_c0_g1_i1:34-474(+)